MRPLLRALYALKRAAWKLIAPARATPLGW